MNNIGFLSGPKILKIFFLLFIQENIDAQSFVLKGIIPEKDSGYVVLRYFRDSIKKNLTDTAVVSKGNFQFTGNIAGADFAQLYIYTNFAKNSKYATPIFIEPKEVTIEFTNKGAKKLIIINGSPLQKEYENLKKSTDKESNKLNLLFDSISAIDSHFKNGLISEKTAETKKKKQRKLLSSLLI